VHGSDAGAPRVRRSLQGVCGGRGGRSGGPASACARQRVHAGA